MNELPLASRPSLTFEATVAAESPAPRAIFIPETVIVPAARPQRTESVAFLWKLLELRRFSSLISAFVAENPVDFCREPRAKD